MARSVGTIITAASPLQAGWPIALRAFLAGIGSAADTEALARVHAQRFQGVEEAVKRGSGEEAGFLKFISRERISPTGQGERIAAQRGYVLEQLLSRALSRLQDEGVGRQDGEVPPPADPILRGASRAASASAEVEALSKGLWRSGTTADR